MYDRAAQAGIRVVAGTIVPYNTATRRPERADARDQRLDPRSRPRPTRPIAFADTRAAVRRPESRTRWPNRRTELHPSPAGYRRDGRGDSARCSKRVLRCIL